MKIQQGVPLFTLAWGPHPDGVQFVVEIRANNVPMFQFFLDQEARDDLRAAVSGITVPKSALEKAPIVDLPSVRSLPMNREHRRHQ